MTTDDIVAIIMVSSIALFLLSLPAVAFTVIIMEFMESENNKKREYSLKMMSPDK